MKVKRPNLTLGPLYYLWDGPKWCDFYARIAEEAPIDAVVIGETVCSKRQHFIEPHFAETIDRLERGGKQVLLSSLALVTMERESRQTRELSQQRDYLVEANDLSALGNLSGSAHVIGPLVNVYNAPTARFFAERGAQRICLPPELPFSSIQAITAAKPGPELEVFAFGRVPLAISARCAHARSKGKIKDNCLFVCGEDPDGLVVKTLDQQAFLALNGVQTMSFTCQALLGDLHELTDAGISSFRLSPQDCNMALVATIYRSVIDGKVPAAEALERLSIVYPDVPFSNGFNRGREGALWVVS